MNPPVVVTIAGTDSSGGAGIAADLATFAALGVHGACVVTAVTAQDTTGVRAIHPVPYDVVAAQLDAVLDDLPVAAVKTGMLATPEVVRLVAERCADRLLVVDPVLVATSGAVLATDDVRQAYREALLPVATVATPNAEEALALGLTDGPGVVVTRGGDLPTTNDHGTGCTHSAALAAHLAHGADIPAAAARADAYVARQLHLGQDWTLGRGRGPVAHIQGDPA
ncbi:MULTISPECIES: hydroxymethylpyrimidine/phosphomethylpyrimidine kinase [unclassified Nocardioides]|uniref:hydroxymethylpyrimidine/phosphomethylpyrimidine kinase n=1 Tax=unclassified Nocardioides TaxID=2615069 RepID=UPI00114F61F4|nr:MULTISPECIES: hydroxymethylpyrimidine/phosphomethylpyrimidine kinase [unclassified Nocardioides]TQK72715.1 hydroxymethylpyrimidine kinase /phosphomethylpyrimidine kinase [Nocardioides sp. SLBN-35]WGY03083.1 hydroxymethylpyrimidine/phosphomethylpyrimidine kinase [Nocardioides sp. QY071]